MKHAPKDRSHRKKQGIIDRQDGVDLLTHREHAPPARHGNGLSEVVELRLEIRLLHEGARGKGPGEGLLRRQEGLNGLHGADVGYLPIALVHCAVGT